MNWKNEAVNDLRKYRAQQMAMENIRERLALLKSQEDGLGASRTDSDRVQGGGAGDRLVNNLAEQTRLELALKTTGHILALVDRGLGQLSPRDRRVLELFYIDRTDDYMDRLTEELCCERAHVYRLKDNALYQFTAAMYGVLET